MNKWQRFPNGLVTLLNEGLGQSAAGPAAADKIQKDCRIVDKDERGVESKTSIRLRAQVTHWFHKGRIEATQTPINFLTQITLAVFSPLHNRWHPGNTH